jgi:hypothetical protein
MLDDAVFELLNPSSAGVHGVYGHLSQKCLHNETIVGTNFRSLSNNYTE